MVALSPVDAWVVDPAWGPAVVGPPYDSLAPTERRRLADADPDSFFNVVRSPADQEGAADHDGDDGGGAEPDDLLAGNARALERLLASGRYLPPPPDGPTLHVYGLGPATRGRRQLAVVGDVDVAAFRRGEVRAHERTRAAKEDELAGHLRRLRMSSSPVGLTYRASARVDEAVARITAGEPLVDFAARDGGRQQVWRVGRAQGAGLAAAFAADVDGAYIVDGHHRVAAAARVGDPTFLAGLVPHDQLHLLPYHRVVAGPLARPPAELVTGAGAEPLAGAPGAAPAEPPPGQVHLYVGGRWYRVRLRPERPAVLDVEAVGSQLLGPLVGVDDPRRDPRLDFVPGNVGLDRLAQLADQRRGLAVALHAPGVEELLAAADAGRTLPPKSTWFEPKLRSGVFVVRRPPLGSRVSAG